MKQSEEFIRQFQSDKTTLKHRREHDDHTTSNNEYWANKGKPGIPAEHHKLYADATNHCTKAEKFIIDNPQTILSHMP